MNYMTKDRTAYRKTPIYRKSVTKNRWKRWGIIHSLGLDYLYDVIYLPATNCSKCNVLLEQVEIKNIATTII